MANQYTSPWTEEKNDFLHEHAGLKSLSWMAEELEKSEHAIERQLQRLGIADRHLISGTLSANQLAEALNVDSKTVARWIHEKRLPATQGDFYYQRAKKFKPNHYKRYFINPDVFWRWASKNRELINWSKTPINGLPPEPAWVEKERRKRPTKRPWSFEESELVWSLYYKYEMPHKSIALMLERTPNSIEKRLARMRKERMAQS